jgi:mono/diheme cytochrome c family protein
MRHNDGNWAGYTYEWNSAGTDATRVVGGKTVTVNGQTWDFPSESQCLQCHNVAAGRSLGLEIGTLNGDFGYPTGRTANQLTTLNTIDTLTPALTQPASALPAIPDHQGSATLASRARAYLHSNCGYCHRPGGPTPVDLDFRYTTTLANTMACDITPINDLGIANARRIAPGSAARSTVVARVNRTGADAMPPLARHTIDTAGAQLLTDWVNGLTSCN